MKNIDLIEVYNLITEDNPKIPIHSIEITNDIINVIALLDDSYSNICQINVNTKEINVNEFVKIYDNFTLNKRKLCKILNKK